MRLYRDRIFPYLTKKNMRRPEIIALRRELISHAQGEVLEIGVGNWFNLSFYPEGIRQITAVDCIERPIPASPMKVNYCLGSAEVLPFRDQSFDTIVSTFCFCSIHNLNVAVHELRRVLRPDGRVLFLEHGRAASRHFRLLQDLSNPFFIWLAFGCHVNRSYQKELKEAGFSYLDYQVRKTNLSPKFIVGDIYIGEARI